MEVQPWMGFGGAGQAEQHQVLTRDQRAERSADRLVTLDQVPTEIRFELCKGLKRCLDRQQVESLQEGGCVGRSIGSQCGDGAFGG